MSRSNGLVAVRAGLDRAHTLFVAFAVFAALFCLSYSAFALDPLPDPLQLTSPNPVTTGRFGNALTAVPDADDDGIMDYAVGAMSENDTLTTVGHVYLYNTYGDLLKTLKSPNPKSGSQFGFAISGISDVDGDGKGDVLVGAGMEDADSKAGAGRAYVFSSASGQAILSLVSPRSEVDGGFGGSVLALPDINADGKPEILVGAPMEDSATTNGGRAYLFSSKDGQLVQEIESPNKEVNGGFGARLAAIPDLNGDDIKDFAISAWMETVDAKKFAGRVYVFSGANRQVVWTLKSNRVSPGNDLVQLLGNFGSSIAGLTDLNGDGKGEIAVGAWKDQGTNALGATIAKGYVHLFNGATGTIMRSFAAPSAYAEANDITGNFGVSVTGVPDVDADGKMDLLVGAWGDDIKINDVVTTDAGHAFLFSTAAPTYTLQNAIVSPNPSVSPVTPFFTIIFHTYGNFGSSVLGLPEDVTGDGKGDFLVGAPQETKGANERTGMAYVYFSDPLPPKADPVDPDSSAKLWEKY